MSPAASVASFRVRVSAPRFVVSPLALLGLLLSLLLTGAGILLPATSG